MSSLIIVTDFDTRPKRQAEFDKSARRILSLWNGARVARVKTGQDMLNAIEGCRHLEQVAILMHGWPTHIGPRRWRGVHCRVHKPPRWVDIGHLADVLGPRLVDEAHVAICACNAAARRGHSSWSWRSYGPGGAGSFCDELYWQLMAWADVRVIGHSARGHTTRNVAKRQWAPYQRGASVMDMHMGKDAHRSRRARAAWVAIMETVDVNGYSNAERLMAGVPLVG